ncbi:hypothetical protein [Pseudoduganella armeniaca]|nr:hypothetical protein [Pseudoduganella armeniaca]
MDNKDDKRQQLIHAMLAQPDGAPRPGSRITTCCHGAHWRST